MAENKVPAGRRRRGFVFALLFGPALLLILISKRGCEHKFKELDDMGALPSYSFVSSTGKKYTERSFKNKVVLFTTIQTTCPDSCAISLWHVNQMIYQHIRKNQKKLGYVKLVSFVTDGKGNPVNNLKDISYIMKDQVEDYDPKIWILASGDAKKLYDVERNGESLLQTGSKYYGGQAFQEIMLLVDKENHLRMVLKGNAEGMIRKMKEHIALLDKQYDKAAYKEKH